MINLIEIKEGGKRGTFISLKTGEVLGVYTGGKLGQAMQQGRGHW